MTTYEHDLLTARFAALTPRPLHGDWGDVLDRAGAVRPRRRRLARSLWRGGRRRKLVVALAVAVLVAAVAAAAYATVRVLFLDRGFVGFPPVEATPSAPESGELVLSFIGRSTTLELRMTSVFVYADGRVIWVREGGAPAGANKSTSGFLEQRLTPEGVELLRSKVLSTGLFRHDVDLITGSAEYLQPGQVELFRGTIQARNGERLVRVRWMNRAHLRDVLSDFPGTYSGTTATPEQERALERLDPLLVDPAASLPASAWQDRRVRAYVAAKYATCWAHRPELGPDKPAQAIPPSRVLTLLPEAVADVLRRGGSVRWGDNPPTDCSVVPTKEARAIARALDDAGLEEGVVGNGIDAGLGGLTYRLKAPEGRPGHVYVFFEPALPHGEWICTACG
jgi:hypothetical protein